MKENPFDIFAQTLNENGFIIENDGFIKPDLSFTLATISKEGKPNARILFLKKFLNNEFIFFTNKNSVKGQDIEFNNNISACFFFPQTLKQIRIEGIAVEGSATESIEYFNARPTLSKAASILSNQSAVLENYHEFEKKVVELASSGKDLQKPDFWTCYKIIPNEIEFWEGNAGRINFRTKYKKDLNFTDLWFKFHLHP